MTRYKKQELKIVLGGFIGVLILTVILGLAVTGKLSKKQEPVTAAPSQTEEKASEEKPSEEKTENQTEKSSEKEEEKTSEKDEEKTSEEESSVDENGSPFDPQTVTIDEDNWELTLLNTKYKLPDGYKVETAPAVAGSGEVLDKRVQPYYEKMYNAAKKEDIVLTPYSGYRSISTQTRLYNNKVTSYQNSGYSYYEAQIQASHWSMLPGCSEHNFGVAMDICNTRSDFNETKEYEWLQKHAAEYGFIERYTEEKTSITGVAAEPWHWRFVGVENAKAIKESGLCLEEYLDKA